MTIARTLSLAAASTRASRGSRQAVSRGGANGVRLVDARAVAVGPDAAGVQVGLAAALQSEQERLDDSASSAALLASPGEARWITASASEAALAEQVGVGEVTEDGASRPRPVTRAALSSVRTSAVTWWPAATRLGRAARCRRSRCRR